MKWAFTIMTCLSLSTVGCQTGHRNVNHANDIAIDEKDDAVLVWAAPKPQQLETAIAEVESLRLALKRVHFGLNSATLTQAGRQGLDEAAVKPEGLSKVTLFVDGHTDERGTTEYNMALGERRAQIVVDYLLRLGIDTDRLHRVSFGEESPLSNGTGVVDLAKNRRVDFRIMHGDVLFTLDESALLDDSGNPI